MDTILQWNLQSYRTKFGQMKHLLHTHSPLCVCLQETLLNRQLHAFPPSHYNLLPSVPVLQDGHERGAALLIHRRVPFTRLNLNTTLQAVAATLHIRRNITVCSLYLPHIPVTLAALSQLIAQLPTPFLLLGDFNVSSPLWQSGHVVTNERGRIVEDLLLQYPISILNDFSFTHYHIQTNTYSTIDLSICSSQLLTEFEYTVLPHLHDSDHFPILLKRREPLLSAASCPRFKIHRADWTSFT